MLRGMAARMLACATWLVCAHGAASAAPPASQGGGSVATLSADVDGDGAPDAIELGSDGVVRIGGQPRGVVRLAPAIAEGELAVSRYRGKRYVVAQIAVVAPPGPSGSPAMQREAVILSSEGGTWHERMRTPVGGVGLDHD